MSNEKTIPQNDRDVGARIQTGRADDSLTATTNKQRGTHTRGPWALRPDPKRGVSIVSVFGIETNSIAYVQFAGTDLEDGLANANLIAAAPELLGALKEARRAIYAEYVGVFKARTAEHPTLQQIDAAIAKAEGR